MAVNGSGLRTAARVFAMTATLTIGGAAAPWQAVAGATPTRTLTCGNTRVGRTADALSPNQKRVNACVLPVNATLTELVFYISPTSRSGSQVLAGVLYADSHGKPAALLGTTEKLTFSSKSAAGWYHLVFATPLKLKRGEYWCGVITGNTGKVAAEHYDSAIRAEDYNTNTYTAGPSNPFGAFRNTGEQMSLYGVLTQEGVARSGVSVEKLQRIGSSGSFTKAELSAKVGDTVTYEIVVTNTGETTLSLSKFTDANCTNIAGGASSLAAGKSTTWTCEHKLAKEGKYTNVASVEANNGVGRKESNPVTVNAKQPASSLSVEKLQRIGGAGSYTKSELTAKVGDTIDYEIVVTNTGKPTLSLSKFTDANCTNIAGGASSLAAGKSTTWTCEHKLEKEGQYTNVASVEANEGVGRKESNKVTVSTALPNGSCEPSSALSALIFGKDVFSYVPKGYWNASATGISVVNVEGGAVTNTLIPTKGAVNSCASNSQTGVTICVANSNEVYVLKEAKLERELTSSGVGTIGFSGGFCTNCGVAMDSAHNRALIALAVEVKPGESRPAFQFLNLETLSFEPAFVASSGSVSEDPLLDPTRELILSPTEANFYEIVNVTKAGEPAFFNDGPVMARSEGEFDSSGADCSTGIVLASTEFQDQLFLADITQAKFTPGSPAGTWSAPSQVQKLEEAGLHEGANGLAVAQGTHTGVVAGEFGGSEITAIALPETSGSGTPALRDYVSCSIGEWAQGKDPHVVTAYRTPNGGDAIALLGNEGATKLAVIDLTKMLDPAVVKRTAGGHACEAGTLPEAVESFVNVP
jgi:uncharacterized repeat protein (TIGR01451 family)